jgi:hypothetical protein
MHMSEETSAPREGETVPVPDKGGWIDGETGQVLPTPPPDVLTPVKQPGVVLFPPEPAPAPAPAPEKPPEKAPAPAPAKTT